MSRIAYASLGRPGAFTPNARFARAPAAPAPEPAPSDPADDAYASGYRDGQAAAQAEWEAAIMRERQERAIIELAFARFDADSALALRENLRATVVALCEGAILPLALDKDGLARRIETAAAMFQRRHDERTILLHPDDLELVKDSVSDTLELKADPSVERGGLRVETEDGGVEDGPEQWRRAIEEALGSCAP
ncbi:MAG: hypothetical protein MK010_06485 [Erythrobacter sp.]|nr:hypothetical protein [Erythrobacter sp.]